MNAYQSLWWQQAQSDHAIFLLFRRQGAPPCHQLHYLQMVTEKIAKAYFWRSGTPPPKSHAGFVQFMRFLGSVRAAERKRIAKLFRFVRFRDFQSCVQAALPLAYNLERMAPSLAYDGPNPEYPWPRAAPKHAPVTFQFDAWRQLTQTGRGRQLMHIIGASVERFPEYG